MKYRSKDDFQVTSYSECKSCKTLLNDDLLREKQAYIYLHGMMKATGYCQACFDEQVKAVTAKAREEWDNLGY